MVIITRSNDPPYLMPRLPHLPFTLFTQANRQAKRISLMYLVYMDVWANPYHSHLHQS
jgi:hypothetical protein